MPEEGIKYLPKRDILSFEEIERCVRLLASLGIEKVRLTGGEPFLRTDLMKLIDRIVAIDGINAVHLTTNGILTRPHIPQLKALGIRCINLSLDTLNKDRFKIITRRDEFDTTMQTLHALIENNFDVKINMVVMGDKNIEDIISMVEMTRHENIEVRFIEEMPFNGNGTAPVLLDWSYKKIINHIQAHFPTLKKLADPPNSTSYRYQVEGHKGTIGVIAAFSRTFCGTCNRIRITAQGQLKTCLYDNGVLNLKDLMRSGKSDDELTTLLLSAFKNRAKDGIEAGQRSHKTIHESMSTIGG